MKWYPQCLGISKQAFYKRIKSQKINDLNELIMIELVNQCRKEQQQNLGGRKLYFLLQDKLKEHQIKIGRNKFFEFLRANKLLVRKTKRYFITTDSKHQFYKYPNLISNKVPTRAEQLWVSDITYIKTDKGHNYLALVTDAYSKKIMGYKLDNHMKTSLCTDALKMAIKNRKYPDKKLIHHSDRGFQYCNPSYTEFAELNGIIMSMTEKYDPYENALAERINRTMKYEYAMKQTIKNTALAKKMIKKAVYIYNNLRPHLSLDMLTPNKVHLKQNVKYKSYRKNNVNLLELKI